MNKHVPIELNEENVLRIYDDCLMKKKFSSLLSSDSLPTRIFTKNSCGKNSPEICFSKSKIKEYSSAIEYLYGQLDSVHKNTGVLLPSTGALTYNGNLWTKDQKALMSFYYLGVANVTIMPFIIDPITKQLSVDLIDIDPTLSPNDPNYRKKDGQEPADD